jgi:RNA polymerase sigma-70 factor (ECF subfamily)
MNLKREMKLSNSELVTGCVKNSRMHQKALYDKFSTTMYSILFRMFNDREHANDVLQDAFIAIFQTIANLNDPERLAGWVRTIVVRTAIQKMRERSRITFTETTEICDIVLPDYNFTAIQLDEAIRSLPKGNRLVFMLIEIEGYKHKEVAEMLNISEGTSKSQLNYAKKILRRLLNEYTVEYATKK